MTEIVVAARDGVLRAPDGEQFRMVRGKTLANAKHPAVQAYPDNWQPMQLDIDIPDTEESDPGHLEDEFAKELAEARQAAEEYRAQLVAIVDVIMARGLVPPGTDTDEPGWLAKILATQLDTMLSADAHAMDGQLATSADDIPPPPAPRKRTPKPAAP